VIDYRIEKVRCPVLVVLTDGESIAGDIFLSPTSRFRPEPQDPAEFMNEAEAYFALAADDGRAMLVAKENVERVEALAASDPAPDPARNPLRMEVTLVNGASHAGEAHLDTRSERSRLLDYLNSHREQFLQLIQPDRLMLINRRVITHVSELT